MSSIHTVGTCGTRTMTQTFVEFFLSVRSGLKTPHGSPKKRIKEQIETPSTKSSFKFKSFVSNQQNLKKLQSQRAKRKKQAKEHRMGILKNEKKTSKSLEDKKSKMITYDDMCKQRIGVEGPVRPYKITKTGFHGHDDSCSLAEAILIYNCKSISTREEKDCYIPDGYPNQFKPEFCVQKSDLDMIYEGSNSWCPSPAWPGKTIGFRGLRTEHFKTRFRDLEKEVRKFQMDSKEIQDILIKSCEGIAKKQYSTSDFLQYTQIYSNMLTPLEHVMYYVEDLLDDKEILLSEVRVERLEDVFNEAQLKFQILPEFTKSLWVKRMASDSNLYELNQFCTLVVNHSNHEKKISAQFKEMELQYGGHDYLMREYIWKLWYHFDILRRGFSDSSWLRFFSKFKLALERSTKENYEGHEMMNSIVSRKQKVTRSRQYIDRRLHYLKIKSKYS